MTMALQLRRAERARGDASSSMVLEHVEEDEVTKDKADEKQKMVITFFYPEKKNFRKIFSDFDENLHVGQVWGTDKPH